MNSYHTPVLENQVLDILKPASKKVFIDATLGNAGHTIRLLQAASTVYGIDFDSQNLNTSLKRIKDKNLQKNFFAINDNFVNIKTIFDKTIKKPVDGILFDLGLSQNQQKSDNRGFSFNDTKSLDMRINPHKQTLTAQTIINTYSQEQLFDIFSKYSQDIFSQPLSHLIVNTRKNHPIKTAKQLSNLISDFYKSKNHRSKINPATKIFLALKITVNSELENLNQALSDSLDIVKKGGIVAIITFHSTEDRLVKNFIRTNLSKGLIKNATKTKPDYLETKQNPLSRSALLRTFQIK